MLRDPRACRRARVVATVIVLAAVGCDPSGEPPTTLAVPDSADQVLFGVTHTVTSDGVLRIKLEADTVFNYEATQTADLYGVQVEFYSPEGALSSTITARQGTYEWQTQNMEAWGDVVAETPEGRRLTTSILQYDADMDELSGPEPFVFDGPGEHLEGDGFTSDPDFQRVRTERPRRGTVRRAEAERQ